MGVVWGKLLVFCAVTAAMLWLLDRKALRAMEPEIARFTFSLLTALVTAVVVVSVLNAR
ncbi:hypothetical protein NKH77_21665 [Streptomyces sp. M19]